MTSVDVLCIGETMALVTPDPPAPLRTAEHLALGCAGAESNVAAWLAALGSRSAWCGRVGADPLGRRILDDLHGRGIDIDAAVTDDGAPTGVMFKDPRPAGTSVWYYRHGSAGSRLTVADVDEAWRSTPRVVHLSGITPALSDGCAAVTRHAMARAGDDGVTISFDVNHRPVLWRRGDAAEVLLDLAGRADLVFVGRDEAAALWESATAAEVRELLPDVPTLVVKDGAHEAVVYHGNDTVALAPTPIGVVEVVGAGDAFAAGYLHGLLRDLSPRQCLRLGHLLAARAVSSVRDVASDGVDPAALLVLAVSGGG